MKLKRLLTISLLSGSLILSSCDMLLPNISGRNKKSNDDNNSTIYNSDFPGTPGATKLSEQEWEKAFNLKETILNRSVTVEITTKLDTMSQTMYLKLDHGKANISASLSGVEFDSQYVYIHDLTDNDTVTFDLYYSNGDNYRVSSSEVTVNECAINLGLLYYPYGEFTYDNNQSKYVSSGYQYVVEEEGVIFDIQAAMITIKDGLPEEVYFSYLVNNGEVSTDKYTYRAKFLNYGSTTVTLPEIKPVEPKIIDVPEGEKLTLSQMQDALSKAIDKRPEYNYVTILEEDNRYSDCSAFVGYLVYGAWQFYNQADNYEMVIDIDNYVISEDSLYDRSSYGDTSFYYNAEKKEYYILTVESYFSFTYQVETLITLNEYFCVIEQIDAIIDDSEKAIQQTHLNWDINDLHYEIPMTLRNRKFQGVSLIEPETVNKSDGKAFANGCSFFVDENGAVLFTSTKQLIGTSLAEGDNPLGPVLVDEYSEMYGYCYSDGIESEIDFSIAGDGNSYSYIDYTIFELTIEGNQVTLRGDDLAIVFEFYAISDDHVVFPEVRNLNAYPYYGFYTFKGFRIDCSSEEGYDAANEYMSKNCDAIAYYEYYFSIDQDASATFSYDGILGVGLCEEPNSLNEIILNVQYKIDPETYEYILPLGIVNITLVIIDETTLGIVLCSEESFTICAAFERQ